MAYQPIQMPQPESPGLFEAYMRAQDLKRLQSHDAADLLQTGVTNERQKTLDKQQAYLKAMELAKGGDLKGMQSMLAPYASDFQEGEEEIGGPKSIMSAPQNPPAGGSPQGGSPLPDMMEFGGPPGPGPAEEQDAFNYQGPQIGPPDQEQESFNYQGPPEPSPSPTSAPMSAPQGPPDLGAHAEALQNPLVAAAAATKKRKFLKFKMDGQDFNINPDAMREEQRNRAISQVQDAMHEIKDPDMKELWENQVLPVMKTTDKEMDPGDVIRMMTVASQEKRQAKAAELQVERQAHVEEMRLAKEDRDRAQWEKGQSNTYRNVLAGINATNARVGEDRPLAPEERKAGALADKMLTLNDTLNKQEGGFSGLDARTILEDAPKEEWLNKNPAAKVGSQYLGAYKALEEKLSPEGKVYLTNAREFITAVLRRESGAAISESEWRDAFGRFLPQVGNSPAQLEAKARNRQLAIEQVAKEGRAGGDVLTKVSAQMGKEAKPIEVSPGKPMKGPAKSKSNPLAQAGELSAAEKWLKDNPNDPDAAGVRAKIAKLKGKKQ